MAERARRDEALRFSDKEARRLELNTIEVDTTTTVDDLARRVAESFGL
jgi:hypothetical protein